MNSVKLCSNQSGVKSRRGFTMVELLVVIAIIVLLAAIIFPVFNRVRERARQTSCMANMRQVGMALTMYMGDKGDRLPPMIQGDSIYPDRSNYKYGKWSEKPSTPADRFIIADQGNAFHYYSWMDCIYPYTKSIEIFTCPSHSGLYPEDVSKRNPPFDGTPDEHEGVMGENMNMRWLPSLAINGTMTFKAFRRNDRNWSLGEMAGVSGKIMFVHWASPYAYAVPSDFGRYAKWPASDPRSGGPGNQKKMFPHNDGVNIVFLDGHTKYYSRKASVKLACDPPGMTTYYSGPIAEGGVPCGYWNPVVEAPAA